MVNNTPSTLEICITDFCNLDCPLCGQGTPLHKDKKTMTRPQIERIGELLRPGEFECIKVSGGEPTIHKDFRWICQNLKRIFPSRILQIATNGALAGRYLDELRVFDRVELSEYPGLNEKEFVQVTSLYKQDNLLATTKREYAEFTDVYREANLDKRDVYRHCGYNRVKKVVQGRIYPCCVVFGQSQRQGFAAETVSVPFDENWRQTLAKVNIEKHCRRCCTDVAAPRASRLMRQWWRLKLAFRPPSPHRTLAVPR